MEVYKRPGPFIHFLKRVLANINRHFFSPLSEKGNAVRCCAVKKIARFLFF
jgi:hypothetical protein